MSIEISLHRDLNTLVAAGHRRSHDIRSSHRRKSESNENTSGLKNKIIATQICLHTIENTIVENKYY